MNKDLKKRGRIFAVFVQTLSLSLSLSLLLSLLLCHGDADALTFASYSSVEGPSECLRFSLAQPRTFFSD